MKKINNNELKALVYMCKHKDDASFILINPFLGEVIFPHGSYGDLDSDSKIVGYGFEHIVKERYFANRLNTTQITSLIFKIIEMVKNVKPIERQFSFLLSKDGVEVIITKTWFKSTARYVITGYGISQKGGRIKKEAMDTILTVSAKYSFLLEFSSVRTQVGAIISSINNIKKFNKKVKFKKSGPPCLRHRGLVGVDRFIDDR